MISCILLTAGESKRFNSPKALAQIHSQKAIERLQQKLMTSSVDEIIVVTGAHETLIKPYVFNHSKVRLVYNKDYKFGQTSSFQTGLNSVDERSEGFMLLPVDCPFVETSTIDLMVREFQEQKPAILVPSYHQKRGHPPIFHAKLKNQLLELPTSKGLNTLMTPETVQVLEINDPGIILTFNTQEELQEVLRLVN
jgi:molybdenum cofactor cytidylyltransferase